MLIKIYRETDSTWYDASDYVIDCGRFTLYERNDDFTPVISTSTLLLSYQFPETISIGDKVQLYLDATHYYNYIIRDVQYKYDKRSYEITFENAFSLLKDAVVSRGNLHSLLTNTSNANLYRANDNAMYYQQVPDGGFPVSNNVSVLWVIKNMFLFHGLTLDTTQIESIQIGYFAKSGMTITGENAIVRARDIKFDENMLYMIGIDRSCSDLQYWTGGEYLPISDWDRITMWDLLSEICFHFGWMIYNKIGDEYILISKDQNDIYNPADNILINKGQKKYYKKYTFSSNVQYKSITDTRWFYYTNGWFDNAERTPSSKGFDLEAGGIGSKQLYEIPINFVFLFAKKDGNAGDVVILPFNQGGSWNDASGIYWQMYYNAYIGNYSHTYYDTQCRDYTVYTYETENIISDIYYNVLSFSYNIKNRTTEIETMVFD